MSTEQERAYRARYERLRMADVRRNGPRRLDATGTRRRIHALAAIGWPLEAVAEAIGVGRDAVWLLTRRRWVHRSTAARVAAVYVRLSDLQGPSPRTAARAAANGWLAPIWWDDDTIDDPTWQPPTKGTARRRRDDVDEVVVRRLIDGEYAGPRATPAERLAAYRALLEHGVGHAEATDRLGISGRRGRELEQLLAGDADGISEVA